MNINGETTTDPLIISNAFAKHYSVNVPSIIESKFGNNLTEECTKMDRLILLKDECSCLANCDEVIFVIEDTDSREWFLGSNLQWGLKEYPKMRLKRDVIFSFSDVLVYIGGMAGLFLGCSVLSFIEIIYFFTLRLYWFVVKYGEETRRMR
ncbi:hypothetical protein JTB14_010974 [Gonioctena quinquepunctata]|nr:hypothetical protein JTB14_010974 [Gonioctena quinquepunctata]